MISIKNKTTQLPLTERKPVLRSGLFAFVLFFVLSACNPGAGSTPASRSDEEGIVDPEADRAIISRGVAAFLDSVSRKRSLSISQIRQFSTIDSALYTGNYPNAVFTGDTVVQLKQNLKAAIVDYNDGLNCSGKFLLLFLPGRERSADVQIVETDCDRDESSEYNFIRYRFLSDSSFETIETYLPAVAKKADSVQTLRKWKLGQNGHIVPL